MHSALTALGLFLGLVAVALLGRVVRQRLPDTHLSGDSKDAVKLGVVDSLTPRAREVYPGLPGWFAQQVFPDLYRRFI